MLIAFLGAGSEYTLGEMAQEARRRGHGVVELNMYDPAWRNRAACLPPGAFTLVTSHHPFMDAALHRRLFDRAADVEALPPFIGRFRPHRSFFVPHDLSQPFHDAELSALYLFDALLMPDDRFWFLAASLPVHVVGWIGGRPRTEFARTPLTLLASDVSFYLRRDLSDFQAVFGDVLAMQPRVKFPIFPDVDRLEAIAIELGGIVVDATVDSTSLIAASDCVVTNGVSSILSEATRWGRRTVCILDGRPSISEQRKMLAMLPAVQQTLPGATAATIAAFDAGKPMPVLPTPAPFDYALAFAVIENA